MLPRAIIQRIKYFASPLQAIIKLAFLSGLIIFLSGCNNNGYSGTYLGRSSYSDEETAIYREDAISDYWDEIREYLDGTETVEACTDSGCYSLDADISDGYVTTLYFNNGGYLDFYAEIDSNGYAYDSDEEGRDWDFSIDSYLIDDALEEWADANGYTLE